MMSMLRLPNIEEASEGIAQVNEETIVVVTHATKPIDLNLLAHPLDPLVSATKKTKVLLK